MCLVFDQINREEQKRMSEREEKSEWPRFHLSLAPLLYIRLEVVVFIISSLNGVYNYK